MTFDPKQPIPGLYKLARAVKITKPDRRIAHGWESEEGLSEGILIRVTVTPRSFPDTDGLSPEAVARVMARFVEAGPDVRVCLPSRVPGYPDAISLTWLDHDDDTVPANVKAFLREVFSCMDLYTRGSGALAQIRNDGDYPWDWILIRLLESGKVSEADVRAECDAMDKEEP